MSLSEDGGLAAGGDGGLAGEGDRASAPGGLCLIAPGDGDAAGGLAGDAVDSVRGADAGDNADAGDRGARAAASRSADALRSRNRSRMSSSDDSAPSAATDRCQAWRPRDCGDVVGLGLGGDGGVAMACSTSARDGVAGDGPARSAAAVASSGGEVTAATPTWGRSRRSQASRSFQVAALNRRPTIAPGMPTSSNSNARPSASVAATASARRYAPTSTLLTSAPPRPSRARRTPPSRTTWRRFHARPSAARSRSQLSPVGGGVDGVAGSGGTSAATGRFRQRGASLEEVGDRSGRGECSAKKASVGDRGSASDEDDEPVVPWVSAKNASVGESGSEDDADGGAGASASKEGDGARKGGGRAGAARRSRNAGTAPGDGARPVEASSDTAVGAPRAARIAASKLVTQASRSAADSHRRTRSAPPLMDAASSTSWTARPGMAPTKSIRAQDATGCASGRAASASSTKPMSFVWSSSKNRRL